MKILQIYKTYLTDSTGGVEQVMKQIALGSSRLGVENRILCLSRDPDPCVIQKEEATIYRFPLNIEIASTGLSYHALKGFHELVDWADVIHYHYPWPFADLMHFMARVQKPSLVTYHSDIVRQRYLMMLYRPLQNAFLRSVSKIVVTSPNYFTTSKALSAFSDKAVVIPIGIDQASYPMPSLASVRKWLDQFGDRFFLFVGVLRYYKGLHILLKAVQNTSIKVVIVGAGPTEKELKAVVQKEGLHNVHFIGHVDEEDKMALLQLSYGFVFPSHLRSEAFGISLLEAAMLSKPLISSEIGTGTSFINIHEETGFVVPPSDPVALREAMQTMLNHPRQAMSFGQAAYKRYLDLFTADQMARRYMALYTHLASRCEL